MKVVERKNIQNTSITLYMLPVHTMAHLGLVARMHKYCIGIKSKTLFIMCVLYHKDIKIKDDIIRHHKRKSFTHYGKKCWWRNSINTQTFCILLELFWPARFLLHRWNVKFFYKCILGDWRLKLINQSSQCILGHPAF